MVTKKKGAAVGAGVLATAAMAGALAAYLFYGKEGKGRRRQAKAWVLKMRGEVLERLEGLNKVSQGVYEKAVDEIARTYRGLEGVDRRELSSLATDLKKHWRRVEKQFMKSRGKRLRTRR